MTMKTGEMTTLCPGDLYKIVGRCFCWSRILWTENWETSSQDWAPVDRLCESGGCPQRLWILSGTVPAVLPVHIGALCMGGAAQRYRWGLWSLLHQNRNDARWPVWAVEEQKNKNLVCGKYEWSRGSDTSKASTRSKRKQDTNKDFCGPGIVSFR